MRKVTNDGNAVFSAVLLVLIFTPVAFAQTTERLSSTSGNQYSPSIEQIWEAQKQSNGGQDFQVLEGDQQGRKVVRVNGLPPGFRDLIISDDQIIVNAVIPGIYQHLGFTGAESLKFSGSRDGMMGETHYDFREYINGIEVAASSLVARVDPGSHQVIGLRGALYIDQGYDTLPNMSMDEAIAFAVVHALTEEQQLGPTYKVDDKDAMTLSVRYVNWPGEKGLQAVWIVGVPLLNPEFALRRADLTVLPDGTVRGGMKVGVTP